MNTTFILHVNNWYWGETHTIISEDGKGVVDVQFDNTMPNVAFIKGLSVFVGERKKGLGTRLMHHAHEEGRAMGKEFAQLCANKEQNWLVDWYKELGYKILYSDEHEYTMIKSL